MNESTTKGCPLILAVHRIGWPYGRFPIQPNRLQTDSYFNPSTRYKSDSAR